ncbi:tetratricopeptide repeat protein [Cystobacter fuscus]
MPSLGEMLAMGQVKQAAVLANQRLSRDPNDGEALVTLAKVSLVEGDGARAESLLQQAAAQGARRDVALVRGALALQREDWEAARTLYLPLAAQGDDRPEVWYGLGVVLLRLGNAEAAREALERAVTIDPQAASYRFELGRAWAMGERVRPAVRQFVCCLRLDARDARAWRFLAELLARRGKVRAAERLLKRGLELVPEAAVLREPLPTPAPAADPNAALIERVVELLGRGRNREALALVREAEGKGVRSLTLKLLEAKACESLIRPDEEGAIHAYEEAMGMDPKAWEACNDLGLFLLRRGQRYAAHAIEVLREARRRAPTRPEPVFNLAVACSKGGRTTESAELARRLVSTLPPEHPFHGHARALLQKLGEA